MRVYGGPCRFWLLENFLCAPKFDYGGGVQKTQMVHSPLDQALLQSGQHERATFPRDHCIGMIGKAYLPD